MVRFNEEDIVTIGEILKEELSVSDEVVVATRIIGNAIIDDIYKNNNTQDWYNIKYKQNRMELFDVDFIGSVTINYVCYFPKDDIQLSNTHKNKLGAATILKKVVIEDNKLQNLVLNIELVYYAGDFQSYFFDTALYHEILHAYEKYKELCGEIISHTSNIYDLAIKNLKNNNQYIQFASNIIYLTTKQEQDAYAGQLYQYLMSSTDGIVDLNTILQHGWAGEAYQRYNQYLSEFNNGSVDTNSKEYIAACKFFGKQNLKDYLYDLLLRGRKRYLNKVGKVYSKYRKDKKGSVMENFRVYPRNKDEVRRIISEEVNEYNQKVIKTDFYFPFRVSTPPITK